MAPSLHQTLSRGRQHACAGAWGASHCTSFDNPKCAHRSFQAAGCKDTWFLGSGVWYRRPECRGAAEKSLISTRTASEAHREAGLAAIDALADRLSATRLEDLGLRAHIPVVPLVGTTRGSRYEMAEVLPSTKGHTKAALRTWRGRKS